MDMQIPMMGKIRPYEYQFNIIEDIKTHIRNEWVSLGKMKSREKVDPVFVEAYVSAGKTIMIGGLINHNYKVMNNTGKTIRTLVLASTGELVEQNAEEIWNMGGQCSIFSASLSSKSTHFPVVVGTIGTVANALDKHFKAWAPHQIIIDECHEVDWREVMELEKDPARETSNQYARIICHFRALNPAVAIIGLTGTPYRGIERIDGRNSFWRGRVGEAIDRTFLVENGYILPTIFGTTDINYNLEKYDLTAEEEGTKDYTDAELAKMASDAMSQKNESGESLTHVIMRDVVERTKNRLGVLITCASEKHCLHAAEVLPEGSYAIITQSTKKKDRADLMKKIKKGEIKYTFQIGCLTTGVNVPYWSDSVILRRIGSLTLFTQLLGRCMRLLKPEHMEKGWHKTDHRVWDYSGTSEALHKQFDNPLLDEAVDQRKKKKGSDAPKICPLCNYENAAMARRCMGEKVINGNKERCEHFWSFIECKKETCRAKNSPGARECRKCGSQLVDPNRNLTGKHYGPDDWKPVKKMNFSRTKNGNGLVVDFELDVEDINGRKEIAKLFFSPFSSDGAKRIWQHQVVNRLVASWPDRKKVMGFKNIEAIFEHIHLFRQPTEITHRINDKNKSVINGMNFDD